MALQELERRDVWITMSGVGLALFMASLDQTIVATAMPRIVKDLGGFESYSGVITAYLVASTAILPIAGKLSDVYGRKPFLLGGILWFTVASVLCGLSHSMGQLIAFRALQGLGAGTMTCAASTTIADLFPPSQRGKVIGILVPISAVSSVIGPLAGGFLTDGAGWPYVFYVNLPVGLLGVAVLYRFSPYIRPAAVKDFKIDYLGVAALVASVVPLLLALNGIDKTHSWSSPKVLGMVLTGIVMGLVFLGVEKKASHPILPLELFRYSIVSICLTSAALVSACMVGITFFVPLFVQEVLGADAKTSGATLLPFTFTFIAVVAVVGQLMSRLGKYKVFAIWGPVLGAVGGFLLAQATPATSRGTLEIDLAIAAVGLAASVPIYNMATQNAVPMHLLGSGTSMVNFMRAIGSSLGVAVFGSILNAQMPQVGLASALDRVFMVIPVVLGATAILAFYLEEKPLRKTTAAQTPVEDLETVEPV